MAMAQFLVQTSSTHERNHHDEGKMCLKILIYNNQEKQHTIVDERPEMK